MTKHTPIFALGELLLNSAGKPAVKFKRRQPFAEILAQALKPCPSEDPRDWGGSKLGVDPNDFPSVKAPMLKDR